MSKLSDQKIATAILQMLEERGSDKTICPSEVARELSPDGWRELMPQIRKTADALKSDKQIEILQKGKRIDSAQRAVGPIRLKAHKA